MRNKLLFFSSAANESIFNVDLSCSSNVISSNMSNIGKSLYGNLSLIVSVVNSILHNIIINSISDSSIACAIIRIKLLSIVSSTTSYLTKSLIFAKLLNISASSIASLPSKSISKIISNSYSVLTSILKSNTRVLTATRAIAVSIIKQSTEAISIASYILVRPTRVYDSFTDTSATDITAHTSDTGSSWTNHTLISGSAIKITTLNRTYNTSTGGGTSLVYQNDTNLTDYEVEARFDCLSNLATDNIGIFGRASTSVQTYYLLRYNSNAWSLFRFISGSSTQISTSYSDIFTIGQSRTVRLSMIGTSIKAYINGVERISGTDSNISGPGYAGIRSIVNQSMSTGRQLDYFRVIDYTNNGFISRTISKIITNMTSMIASYRGSIDKALNLNNPVILQIVKSIPETLSSITTISNTIEKLLVIYKMLSISVATSSNILKTVGKNIIHNVVSGITILKSTPHNLLYELTTSATLNALKGRYQSLSVEVNNIANLVLTSFKTLYTSIIVESNINKLISILQSINTSIIETLEVHKVFIVSIFLNVYITTSNILKSINKNIAMIVNNTSNIARNITKNVALVVMVISNIFKRFSLSLLSYISNSGQLSARYIQNIIMTSITSVYGNITKTISKTISEITNIVPGIIKKYGNMKRKIIAFFIQ